MNPSIPLSPDTILSNARALRWEIGGDFHEQLLESIYTDAAQIAARAVPRPDKKQRFDFEHNLDRILTSRKWGFPLMIVLLAIVFWLTISGANVPSNLLSKLLIDTLQPLLHQRSEE